MARSPIAAAAALISLVALWAAPSLAGKLDRIREEVRTPPSSSDDDETSSESSSDYSSSDFDELGDSSEDWEIDPAGGDDVSEGSLVWAEIVFGYVLGLPFWVPHVLVEGEEERGRTYFSAYPYRGGRGSGYVRFAPAEGVPPVVTDEGDVLIGAGERPPGYVPRSSQLFYAQAAFEYGHDLEEVLRPSAYLALETAWRIGLESGWTYLREYIAPGELDRLAIGDVNLTVRFAEHERLMMRAGAGVRLMYDDEQTDAGFNFTYGLDLFPVRPLVISASVDLGNLGWALVVHGRATLGATHWGAELYAGWDVMLVNEIPIHGPIAGFRYWF